MFRQNINKMDDRYKKIFSINKETHFLRNIVALKTDGFVGLCTGPFCYSNNNGL